MSCYVESGVRVGLCMVIVLMDCSGWVELWLVIVGIRCLSYCIRVLYIIRVLVIRVFVYGGGFVILDDDIGIIVSILV